MATTPNKRNSANLGRRVILGIARRIRAKLDRRAFTAPLSGVAAALLRADLEAARTAKEVRSSDRMSFSPLHRNLASHGEPRTDRQTRCAYRREISGCMDEFRCLSEYVLNRMNHCFRRRRRLVVAIARIADVAARICMRS
ncbi:MAG: hypothetical protein KGJ79_13060 [Alphaproteobacteria bacterium]|nr:hypothetical protein [Alphaproteobacteria bacterium]MDE2492451.1 hypothetical protein [Alphaproteobacteria bacterium]